jgi:hypothetical protein
VNSPAEYRRHTYRLAEPSQSVRSADAADSELAHHRDPSLSAAEAPAPAKAAKGIAWVRPTELATYVTPVVGRGVDLHAELMRRARRTPVTTKRALQRSVPSSPSPTPSANHTEGLSL